MNGQIESIIEQFGVTGTFKPFGNGHINDTFMIVGKDNNYVLQRINKTIFKNPEQVMENICRICEFVSRKYQQMGKDYERRALKVVKTIDGKPYYKTQDGEYYRMYLFVENTQSFDQLDDLSMIKKAGAGFGEFAYFLQDFEIKTLYETIKDFHNTPVRYNQLIKSIEDDCANRVQGVLEQIEFVKQRRELCKIVTDEISEGNVPLRVTHNDTKLNNILFDKDTTDAVCVVDLDTVMPGSLLYDFGDAIRSCAHSGAEDEADYNNVVFSLPVFDAFAQGFLSKTVSVMTDKEKELLHLAPRLITFENGMRFLADYLSGDVYFKTKYPEHNLVRANNQFYLVYQMEQHEKEMREIIQKYIQNNI